MSLAFQTFQRRKQERENTRQIQHDKDPTRCPRCGEWRWNRLEHDLLKHPEVARSQIPTQSERLQEESNPDKYAQERTAIEAKEYCVPCHEVPAVPHDCPNCPQCGTGYCAHHAFGTEAFDNVAKKGGA